MELVAMSKTAVEKNDNEPHCATEFRINNGTFNENES